MNAYNDILPSLYLSLLGFKCHKEQSLDIILCIYWSWFLLWNECCSHLRSKLGKRNGNSYGMSRHAIFVFTACILGADWNIEPATLRLCGVAKGWGESQKARLGTIRICINSKRELSHSIFVSLIAKKESWELIIPTSMGLSISLYCQVIWAYIWLFMTVLL